MRIKDRTPEAVRVAHRDDSVTVHPVNTWAEAEAIAQANMDALYVRVVLAAKD